MPLKTILLEPFFGGSHRRWAEGFAAHSTHDIELMTLRGRHWKWRMHGAALTFARLLEDKPRPDLFLATDMLDVATFRGLVGREVPLGLYFHENQLSYPWSENDVEKQRDRNIYGFTNFSSALAADQVFFNSAFHKEQFLRDLGPFLSQFPDKREKGAIRRIEEKSKVLHLGMDLIDYDVHYQQKKEEKAPLILWNHRWEYDKNPDTFFKILFDLKKEGIAFRLAILGKDYKEKPVVFNQAKEILKDEIVHMGFAENKAAYSKWLWEADILPVTSKQDFFGGSAVEALYCQTFPLFPNRLAFPEHLPDFLKKDCLYNNDDELKSKLKNLLQNHLYKKHTADLQEFVKKYDWSNIINKYDTALSKLCSKERF